MSMPSILFEVASISESPILPHPPGASQKRNNAAAADLFQDYY